MPISKHGRNSSLLYFVWICLVAPFPIDSLQLRMGRYLVWLFGFDTLQRMVLSWMSVAIGFGYGYVSVTLPSSKESYLIT